KAETTEIVKSFAKDFATASDGVREAVAGRKELLENYSALTPEQKKAMEEDLKQLDQWDAEVEALLKKRKNGTLTNEDQARLQEILSARAELEIKYSVDPGDGYDQIITKMQAALERGKNSGNVDSTLLGDTMRALAEGRKAYMEALNQSYDAEYAQISLIEDESSRMAALAALNEEYQAKRARGQEEYSKAVQEAGKDVWENSDQLAEQIANIDKLAEMVGEFNGIEPGAWVDPSQIEALNEFVQGMSEADLAGMLALIEQMKDAGMSDEDLKSLGIDYDDIKGKLEAIRDVAQSVEGLEPVSELIGTALPEEVTRVLVGLDLTQATTDWETFASGGSLTPISAAVEITGDVDVTGLAVTGTPTGTVTVTGELAPVIKTKEGLAYKVADFKVGVNGELDEITLENGKTYEITGYKVGVDGQLQSVTTKSGETYEVAGFSVPVNGSLKKTITAEDGVAYEVAGFTVDVDGKLKAVTTKDGVTYEIAGYSIGVDGKLQTVTTEDGKTYAIDGFEVDVNGRLAELVA
ncbi:MAG: hypothetical protein IJH59_09245, partial [Firmicutes bacterium]|nr:hypothetical protein [Bacillota bacterium]